ncbi:hypothetical protein K227x_51200 [Rubripirellula lacrimiformis]|uniref:DUF1573 domain-containing protein n=1 Tax=Rubripirellula lacrimiformis TaxID=1930273 RepID=A0A517NHU3_9BACT|nr:DUF1573 domain-containing protein [Rubripirellula lacrimiformis]QDT06704.1 hypothetical protein K227x_51200 [Rubripirellula lacrimiformis]
MKNLWVWIIVSALIGTGTAWTINYQRYGYRPSEFGPFRVGGDVTPENVAKFINLRSQEASETYGRVQVDGETEHDFGVMSPGDEGEKKFTVRNVGKGQLRLRVGASTCKCTIGELDKTVLEPGEQTDITLTWTVKPGSSEFGQSAQLLTNDPGMVAITLKITGKIVSDFQLVPEVWTFGEIAAGEPFEVSGLVYNFMSKPVDPVDVRFSDEKLTALSEFDIEELDRADFGTGNQKAVQAFRVTAKVQAGLPQGNISQNLVFGFNMAQPDDESDSETSQETKDDDAGDEELSATDSKLYASIPVKGRIVGALRMLESSKLTQVGTEFIYDFGRIGPDDSLIAKTFVVLKGEERDNTTLTVGKIKPEGVVRAELGEPKSRGSMVLYPLKIELVPSDKTISRLGKDKGDYGSIWIESDNPKASRMRVVLKFAIEGR